MPNARTMNANKIAKKFAASRNNADKQKSNNNGNGNNPNLAQKESIVFDAAAAAAAVVAASPAPVSASAASAAQPVPEATPPFLGTPSASSAAAEPPSATAQASSNAATSALAAAAAAAVSCSGSKAASKGSGTGGGNGTGTGTGTASSSSSSSSPLSSSSSVGIVQAISTALQNISYKRTGDTSDTDAELSISRLLHFQSDEESVSEILLACLCLRPDLLDDIPESDSESCGNDGDGNEDDGDDEDEDEEDDIQDPGEVTGNFLLDTATDQSRKLTALFESAANEKAPVLRHATLAIDETKQALTKMRCANSPRDKTIFNRTLIAACTDNDVNTVRRLLGKGNININESTDDGESLLSMACSAGYYELAQVLLAMSAAQVEDKGTKDCTPLMEAASAGHLDIVKLLLNHNADVNAQCTTGNTPLMFACAGGHVDVVKELLKHGANVEDQNENGHTPLMESASAGHVEVATVLLEHGAGINTHSNEFKESALTLACYKGHLNMVRFLLQAGADQEHKTDEMHTALMEASMDGHVEVARLLLDSGAQVNMPTDSFESPLTLAACGGHVELATLLIERGANIEEVNDEGYTPLMEAAREGHEDMVALLLSKGANINATTEETQETALTLACCGGFTEVAEFLIKQGADLELGASTPLMEAAQEGHTDLVKFLLENGANVHAQTQTGDTALTHACENGHTDAAEVLLYFGAELEHESEGGRTPLMKACRAGHLCTVKFLIGKGADVNKQTTSNDHTPLSLACAGGHQAVVEYLLKSNADPFHKLKDNSTMLIEAAKGGHIRVVELLFKYPNFTETQQADLQSNLINSNNAQLQLHGMNLQQQKQIQQQLNQLAAPPGLHEVSEAVRVTNQQMLNQSQQYNPGVIDYNCEENMIGNASEGYVIDPNLRNTQHQEALIAKMRLFQMQAGLEKGIAQGSINTSFIGEPNLSKQKGSFRKNRQPPAPFEMNLNCGDAHDFRSQPLGDESAGPLATAAAAAAALALGGKDDHADVFDELQKANIQLVCDKDGQHHPGAMFDLSEAAVHGIDGTADNIPLIMGPPVVATLDQVPSNLQSYPMFSAYPTSNPVDMPTPSTNKPQTGSGSTLITTLSEVSQSTAISDRPKVKPISKKDLKNLRKPNAVLQKNQMVSIFNNLVSQGVYSETAKKFQQLGKIIGGMSGTDPTSEKSLQQALRTLSSATSQATKCLEEASELTMSKMDEETLKADFANNPEVNQRTLSQFSCQMLKQQYSNADENVPENECHPKSPTETPPSSSSAAPIVVLANETVGGGMDGNVGGSKSQENSGASGGDNVEEDDAERDGNSYGGQAGGDPDDDDDGDEEEEDDNEDEDNEAEEDDEEDEEDDIELNCSSNQDIRKITHCLEDMKSDEIARVLCEFKPNLNVSELVQSFSQLPNFLPQGKLTGVNNLQQFTLNPDKTSGSFGPEDQFRFYQQIDNVDDDTITECGLYPTLGEPLDQFAAVDDQARDQICGYELGMDCMEEFLSVMQNAEQPLTEITANLNCSEFPDFGLGQICKTRWSGWMPPGQQAPADVLSQHLQLQQQQCLQAMVDNQAKALDGQFLSDHHMQARLSDNEIGLLTRMQLPPSQQQSSNPDMLTSSLLQATHQTLMQQNQQLQNGQMLPADSQNAAKIVFNVDTNKPSPSLQLLFQLPPVQQGQTQQPAAIITAQQQQLQQQQQSIPNSGHAIAQNQTSAICQQKMYTPASINNQQQPQQQLQPPHDDSLLTQQVFNQQLVNEMLPQACTQHTQQQVQVATQTQLLPMHSTGDFCNTRPVLLDGNVTEIVPSQAPKLKAAKPCGSVSKKAVDMRKDRKHYTVMRQTPAGSQANTAAQQPPIQQDLQPLKTQVDKTIDVDSETDSNHDTALTLACAGGHEELVELLISRDANIEHRDKKGFTPLILAATAGHEKVVDILLKHRADLEAQSERTKDTPLSLACSGGRYEVVELLLSVGANKEHRNVSDYTPLSLAASGGYVNIIKLLLSHGAEINSRTGSKLGISPLMLAAMNGHTAAVKLLLDQGSDINAQIETNRNTALTLACFQGRHEVVSLLLDRKANVEHRAKTGLTPLMEAASGGYIEVGRVLLDKGADVNAAPVPTSRDTALTIAADKGHLKFVELLLNRGASVEVKNKKGNSPLWLAAHGGHLSVVEVLYQNNADIDSQDNRRVSCLMAAFRKGHTKVVRWMVQHVTQFPSDQELTRIVCTISDKELLDKKYECVKIIRAAKEAQAVKANKNASILLEELDMERTREESRRAAAARRRERKKKKKMEKKEEKRRLLQGDKASSEQNEEKDSDKDAEEDSDKDEEDAEAEVEVEADPEVELGNAPADREEGDSGIDQGSCSSTETKRNLNLAAEKNNKKKSNQNNAGAFNNSPNLPTVPVAGPSTTEDDRKSKKKDDAAVPKSKKAEVASKSDSKKSNQDSAESASVNKKADHKKKEKDVPTKDTNKSKDKENAAPKEDVSNQAPTQKAAKAEKKPVEVAVVAPNASKQPIQAQTESSANKKSIVFTARQPAADKDEVYSRHQPKSANAANSKRSDEGWKEVVRKSSTQQASCSSDRASVANEMICKKVQVPVNAISRVIGRAGSNINAIRATTGAHIEVEKQGKNQSERSITIKGLTDATKHAHFLITALIKDPDVDILQMLPRINPSAKPPPLVVNAWDRNTPISQSVPAASVATNAAAAASGPAKASSKSTSQATYNTQTTAKTSVASSAPKTSGSGRSQPAVSKQGAVAQTSRNTVQGHLSTSTSNLNQKRAQSTSDVLTSATKTTMSYTNAIMSQKNSVPKSQPQSSTAQTFAAKLATSFPSVDTFDSKTVKPPVSHEPTANATEATPNPVGRNTAHSSANNVLGAIGTFNGNFVATTAPTNTSAANTMRSVTPVNQPMQATRIASPPHVQFMNPPVDSAATSIIGQNPNIVASGMQQQQQQQPTVLVSQLSKIGNEYSLFNDSYASQWESKQIYKSNNSDTIPKADASKAPGYNRGNTLSSPISSKTSSKSTTPPGILAPNGQQILSVHTRAASPLSPRASDGAVIKPPMSQNNSAAPVSAPSSSNTDMTDMSNVIKPGAIPNSSSMHPPISSGLAVHRPNQHRPIQSSQMECPNNFGPIGPVGSRNMGSSEQTPSPRYYDQITQQGISQPVGYSSDHLQQQYHLNLGGNAGIPNHSANTISRLNPRATVFSHQNKPNQHLAGLFPQSSGNVGVNAPFQKLGPIGSHHHSMQYNHNTGRPQSQPQTGSNARWIHNNEYAFREMMNMDNSFGIIGSTSGSPKPMSPNDVNNMQQPGNVGILCQPSNQPPHCDDTRKIPRPIGTERAASWKYNNFPTLNTASNIPLLESDPLMGNNIHQWMADKSQQQQVGMQHHQQNWNKPQQPQRFYPGGDYQDQFQQLHMDNYHNSHSSVNTGVPINMMQFPYPHYVGAPDMAQMPDKIDWEHNDKQHAWPNSWST